MVILRLYLVWDLWRLEQERAVSRERALLLVEESASVGAGRWREIRGGRGGCRSVLTRPIFSSRPRTAKGCKGDGSSDGCLTRGCDCSSSEGEAVGCRRRSWWPWCACIRGVTAPRRLEVGASSSVEQDPERMEGLQWSRIGDPAPFSCLPPCHTVFALLPRGFRLSRENRLGTEPSELCGEYTCGIPPLPPCNTMELCRVSI